MIEIIDQTSWVFGQDNCSNGGQVALISKCRHQDTIFYVRENINGIDSFLISSNERWGDKAGSKASKNRQVLELLAPESKWHQLSILVHQIDTHHRPVRSNKLFNMKFIREHFKD